NSVHKTPQGFNISDLRASYMNSASQGFIFVASLHGKPMQHMTKALMANDAAGVRINPPNGSSNCMYWLPSAKVGPGKKDHLFTKLGIKRSLDGVQMAAKLLHSANKRVEVVGVTVKDVSHFDQLTPAQLLGVEPKKGVEGACVF
ncbi:MAG: hypothetical protein JRH20_32620, partial [Deltaproteobacteria bacterium]|nr:hypothetical protein [Deltaproteobacteria bacterium]